LDERVAARRVVQAFVFFRLRRYNRKAIGKGAWRKGAFISHLIFAGRIMWRSPNLLGLKQQHDFRRGEALPRPGQANGLPLHDVILA
jgi:hypothetical protein